MDTKNQLSAWWIGDGSLLRECINLWHQAGHKSVGITSDEPGLKDYAQSQEIPSYSRKEAWITAGQSARPEILFSVVNLKMLGQDALSVPTRISINFHDGPLPQYAGLNVTSWALINGETEHGVTWHAMEKKADSGRIYAKETFEIERGETSFSLNAKCFQMGMKTFKTVIESLGSNHSPQERPEGPRTLYRRAQRPDEHFLIRPSSHAEQLQRAVAASDFSAYPNPLGYLHYRTADGGIYAQRGLWVDSSSAQDNIISTQAGSLELLDVCQYRGKDSTLVEPSTDDLRALSNYKSGFEYRYTQTMTSAPAVLIDETKAQSRAFPLDLETNLDPKILFLLFLRRLGYQGLVGVDGPSSAPWYALERGAFFLSKIDTQNQEQAYESAKSHFEEVQKNWPIKADLPARQHFLATAQYLNGFDIHLGEAKGEAKLVFISDGKKVSIDAPENLSWLPKSFSAFLSSFSCDHQDFLKTPIIEPSVLQAMLENQSSQDTDLKSELSVLKALELFATTQADSPALSDADSTQNFAQLWERVQAIAQALQDLGVQAGDRVGVSHPRSNDLLNALLAIWHLGATYVPLDPAYPKARIDFIRDDAEIKALIVERSDGQTGLVLETAKVESSKENASKAIAATDISDSSTAYILYTSGSTGKPKGVVVSHNNLKNFFAGMDQALGRPENKCFFSVTSINFDISVLELFWSLSRGNHVVLAPDKYSQGSRTNTVCPEISLFYFAANDHDPKSGYRLLFEGAEFADKNGLDAVWTPERHFHAFGGLFPNPSVMSAAIAARTKRIKIRAGSVVAPLHHPIRIAENWALIDHISNGRVGISFASGWQPNDFVLAPKNYEDRKKIMFESIEQVRALWRGEAQSFENPKGEAIEIKTLPRPIQKELPTWVTAAGNPETFRDAGQRGYRILTHLLGQSIEELREKIAIYRRAFREAGHQGEGHVTLMLHTLIGENIEVVKEIVREPMKAYLKSAVDLIKKAAWEFPTFKDKTTLKDGKFSIDHLSEEENDALLEHSFNRYFKTSGLFGTVASCADFVRQTVQAGADEIGCLIDFGVEPDSVLKHLPKLAELKALLKNERATPSYAELMARHPVTHLQATPSQARMFLADQEVSKQLAKLEQMMVGGEALGADLGKDLLLRLDGGELYNMYGPTETTIWSSVQRVRGEDIHLGKAIVGTSMLVVDKSGEPVPQGMVGELLIGGAGVAQGYWKRNDLSKERFLQRSYGGSVPKSWYRSGDRVFFDNDGKLRFLGRLDHQVKLRGYRMELGDIESSLRSQPEIQNVVVLVHKEQLCAFVTGSEQLDIEKTKKSITQELPEYMVPSIWHILSTLPLTPNGKLNYKALQSKLEQEPSREEGVPVERQGSAALIAGIWQEVLGIRNFSDQDNFFDIGGHSLLSIEVQRRLGLALDTQIDLVDLFRFPTIAGLSQHLEGNAQSSAELQRRAERGQARRNVASARASRRGRRGK